MNFLHEAELIGERLSEIRRKFHKIPEIGNKEFKTADLIEKYLDETGIKHRRILDTGIIARIDGKSAGKNSAIRADIDALPVNENTGVDFSSQHKGMMHACGHDVHITGALGAAMLLKKHESELHGSVTFLFQPNEEGEGGAKRMIDAGCLEGIDAVFGAHVDPALPAGHIGVKYGNFYAASAMFKLAVIGRSAHGAQRDKGIDAIEAGAKIIPEILKIPNDRKKYPGGGVVSVGTFHAGTAGNILAGRAELTGIIRTYGTDKRSEMCRELEKISRETAHETGAECEFDIQESCPGIVNDNDRITSLVENTAREILPSENVHIINDPLFISEDFGYFIMNKTGNFYHIGAGCEFPLHSDRFLPVPEAITTAAALHAAVVCKFNSEI